MKFKKCGECKLEKRLEDFHKYEDKDGYFGILYICKKCKNKRRKTLREKRDRETNGLLSVYYSMKARCLGKNCKCYHRYGGRGITICEEWLNDFNSFFEWAKNTGHKKGLQIDRINNDGNYEPSNCRFVTLELNSQNSSSAKLNEKSVREIREMLRSGQKTKDIAEIYNVSSGAIYDVNSGKTWKNII